MIFPPLSRRFQVTDLQIRAVLAGVAFGIWPLLMQRSGLTGYMSAAVFAIFAFITVIPFAVHEGFHGLRAAIPVFYVGAGVVAGFGLLAFNSMLGKATGKQVGSLFLVMLLVQISIPAVYHIYRNQAFDFRKILGVALAIGAGLLLS